MAIKCGIVGLPNVGKSTLFNALTAAEIPAENYPFCTIDPNVGVVPVPDPRLDVLTGIVRPQKTIPTTMEFVDIAGLVEGASKGEGLGNKFLGNIRETHAIAHVVRCFENDDVTHVSGTIDPIGDIETINTELGLADLESASASIGTVRGTVSSSWKRDAQSLTLDVTIPVNCRAKVRVPKMGFEGITIAERGEVVWVDGALVGGVQGIAGSSESATEVTFEVGSGLYRFQLSGTPA